MKRSVTLVMAIMVAGCATVARMESPVVNIGPFSSQRHAAHQERIQAALNRVGAGPTVFRFAPGNYVIGDAKGLRVPANATLLMEGARFLLSKDLAIDGQAFLLDSVANVSIRGGEIIGSRDKWSPAVNVAGIRIFGKAHDIEIMDLKCRDLSSNGIGVFGSDEFPIANISMHHVSITNCCNDYTDYLQPHAGPADGSEREDQGSVAFYHVDDWTVESCQFKGSHSDGTHFFHCRNGHFAHCVVEGSKMGGYFLEGCENVLACGNLIRDNGSRGVTIERDSCFCTLSGNLVEHSGREGVWMPDACSSIIEDNIFIENGRKDDGEKDCEIRLDDTDEYAVRTSNVRIEGNIFKTSAAQTAVIYQAPGVKQIEITDNTFEGPAPQHN